MFTRLSLKYQIAAVIIALVAIVLALELEQTLSAFTASTRAQIERAEQTMLMLLQDSSRRALLTEEYEHVRKVFAQALEDPYVHRVRLANAANRIVLSSTPEEVGSPLPALTETAEQFWRTADFSNHTGPLGLLAIEFSNTPLFESQRAAWNLGAGIATMGIVLIAVVGLGMGILLTRRLHKLTHAAQRLAAGESAVETGLRGQDEIAQVGRAFDTMARNIADSRQQLEDTHAFLQSTLDSLSSHIAILDGSGTILSVNDVWRRFAEANAFLGVSYGVGANYLTLCDKAEGACAEEAPQVAQGIREVMAQQRTHFELDYPCHSPEHPRWFVVKVTCFESPDGLRVVVAHENITALKQSEEALRQSEAQIRAVLDTAVDSIISITEQGTIISFNSAAERLFRYRAEEVRGQNVTVLMPPPYHEEHDRYLAQYLCTGEKKIIGIGREVVGKRKDDTTFPMDLAVGEAHIGDQRLFTGIVRDITERKQAEATLKQAHNELEQRVRDRTADLEVANEEVRRFAYIVSHDLRAPLINLKGFAGELRDLCELLNTILPQLLPHLDDPQRTEVMRAITQDGPEALHFIETSVTRMDDLIRAVLNLSRAGQRELHIEPVDTEALAQHIARTLAHQLAQHDARITLEPLPTVNADHMAMEQILGNLLGNAVKYLEPGRTGEITVRAEREADTTTFYVSDNGRGIAEGDLPRVFELFRRAGRQDTQGEGMGLAFVQTLIRRHGGEITCRSTLGVGTTFTFTLANQLVSGDPDAIA